jgi:CSLREA domain-containing protein
MTVRSILPGRAWLTALGAFFVIALASCQDQPSPTDPLVNPSMAVITQTASAPVVTSLADPGDGTCDGTECTLREAIAYADPGAEITFMAGLSGTITLGGNGTLGIQKNLTITGPGAGNLSVSGSGTWMVFYISSGWGVTISNLTVTGGSTSHDGGGIWSAGSLTLSDCAVTGNSTPAYGGGAGIYQYQGELTISRCVISGNSSGGDGGGIATNRGTVVIEQSTISGNTAADYGGGISNYDGTVLVEESTISGNTAADYGGGIYSNTEMPAAGPAVTTILNSTISGNSASEGGGLYNYEGLTRIILTTITENEASSDGGGVWSWNDAYTQTDVKGSIIWGNTLDDGTTANDVAAANSLPDNRFNSLGYNLIGEGGTGVDFTQEFNFTGDQTGVETANLGGLADNGGSTKTHALLSGSPAINTGTCLDYENATVLTDQRGVSRPQGSACDIGAFEEETSTVEVNTLEDHDDGSCDASDCTLREAIAYAGAGTTITFASDVTGSISLVSQIVISTPLAIDGPGASILAVKGLFERVFDIQAGGTGSVTIRDLTIRDGRSETSGAGVLIQSGTVLLEDVVVSNNSLTTSVPSISGGGIAILGTSALTIRRSSISYNSTSYHGAGIFVAAGSALTVENSTISYNEASGYGGGLYSDGTVTVMNATIAGNTGGYGGGAFIAGGSLAIAFGTVAFNSAASQHGGGIYAMSGTVTLTGTILGDNTAQSSYPDLGGSGVTASYTLIESAADAALFGISDGVNGNVVGSDPGFDGGLTTNGGPTKTVALGAASPAVDQISSGTIGCGGTVATDQRGVSRPQGSACDIGAYEAVVYAAGVRVSKGVTKGAEDIGQLPFTFNLYDPSDGLVETVTLGESGGSADFETEIRTEGSWRVEEVLPTGWVAAGSTSCTFDVSFPADHERTFTCSFDNVEKSRLDLLKLTNGLPTTSQTWNFALYSGADGFGGTLLASENTPPTLLDFSSPDGALDLDPAGTYTLCELEVPAGYSLFWQIDTNGDGTGDATLLPYNPNADDDPREDLGNRCIDIGAGTGVALTPGTTLHFVVNNAEPGGAPRSNGYWKNWNTCTGGGQAAAATANGGYQEGFWLLEDVLTPGIGGGVTWDDISSDGFVFPITSCPMAVDILDQRKVGKSDEVADGKKQASDPLFSLAAHLLAAQLNFGAGVCRTEEVLDWALEAETLLDEYNFDGDGHDNLGKKSEDAARAMELATLLDSYNTGMVCGNGGN